MDLAFTDCVLNLKSRQLTRAGTAVSLEPKMFALLELLVARRPAVVTYNELDELLWPNVYVARTSLTRLVSELRAVLGDSPGDGHIIRTVYKTGYAFAADVTAVNAARRPPTLYSLMWNDRLLALVDGENVVGRGAECSVIIDAATVSRRHARFWVAATGATLEDLGSTNGTFVNDVAITTATPIQDGDWLSFGKARAMIRRVDPAAPTEVTRTGPGDPTQR